MSIPLALFTVLLAASGSPPSPFTGCDAVLVPHGWQYQCGAVRARVEDLPAGSVDVKSHLEGIKAAAPAVVGDGAVTRVERRKLGDKEVEVRITEARERAVLIAVLPRRAGTRVLACVVDRSNPCDAALEWLAAVPWQAGRAPGSKLAKPPPLAIAGRAVQVPADCEQVPVPNGGGVKCPPAFFANWVSVDEAQGRRMAAAFGPATRERLEQNGLRSRQDDAPCLLAGSAATCARLTIEADGRAVAVMLWATAGVGGENIFASCQAPAGAAIRPPCSLVFRSP